MLLTSIIISILFSVSILPRVMIFVKDNCKIIKNYKGRPVYNCGGIFLFINIMLICAFLLIFNTLIYGNAINMSILAVLVGVFSASFTGYIDDNSSASHKGIWGHGRMLLRGKITSGNIKAFIGMIISFIISFAAGYRGYSLLVNTLLISLMQNFINLLDLRPGRGIKAYVVVLLISIPFISLRSVFFYINMGMLISLAFYLPYELRELCMMGDTGANVLGIILGMTTAFSSNIYFKSIMLTFIATAQIYAETKSINDLINRNRVLRTIDLWGRK